MTNQRTEGDMLAEIEKTNAGAGPDPMATFEGAGAVRDPGGTSRPQ